MRHLEHEHIIPFYELFYEVEDGSVSLIFHYCETDLSQFIKKQVLDLTTIKMIFKQIVLALDYCH